MKQISILSSKYGRLCFLVCFCAAVILAAPALCPAAVKNPPPRSSFSLQTNREPLRDVLARVSKATGYKFEISRGWESRPVTADIRNASLQEGIQGILRAMGSPNNAMIIDERGKKIEIKFFEASSSGYPASSTSISVSAKSLHEPKIRPKINDDPVPVDNPPPDFVDDETGPRPLVTR